MYSVTHLLLLASITFDRTFAAYTISQNYNLEAFFKGFFFWDHPDPTDGHVQFLTESSANATHIAGFVDNGNTSYAIYLGVDSTDEAPRGRNAIRVQSNETFQHGLVIADIQHMPEGCGTWPAYWWVGPDWPVNGEVDIIEGVNEQKTNSMTLHTNAGPVLSSTHDYNGTLMSSNCDVNAPNQPQNQGCSISAESTLSFGSGFNANGGGVYATEWTSEAITIWFFSRGAIPSDIASGAPDPSNNWGTPSAVFQGNFSMDEHFNDMSIIFDTTFCGEWAGNQDVWENSTCSSLAPTCDEYVTNNPGAFVNAYWAINGLQVFEDNGSITYNNSSMRRRGPRHVVPRS